MGFQAYFFGLQCLLIAAELATVTSTTTVCSPANRTADLTKCLAGLTAIAESREMYWFGTSYQSRCPRGPISSECLNPYPNQNDSIISRVFGKGKLDNGLDRYIDVKFESTTGSYSVCGNTYRITQRKNITIDPANREVVTPWEVKMAPTLTWTTNSSDELYTVFVVDVGNFINHGIYINIRGNDFASGQGFKPYHGPMRFLPLANIYTVFLFRQNSSISLSDDWYVKLNNSMMTYNMTDAMGALNLTGPVAMNWMQVVGDTYASKLFMDLRILYQCPYLVRYELRTHNRTFIPDEVELSVYLDVTFMPRALTFTSCCTKYDYMTKTLSLNPLGNAGVRGGDVRTNTTISVELAKAGSFLQYKNFTNTLYTLLCVDPDVPSASAGTQEKPLLHWQAINIQNGDISTSDVLMTYAGPLPPDNKPHYYYFLLYEQEKLLNSSMFPNYTTPANSRLLFDISAFVADQNLTLVGASWMNATTDEYTRYEYTELRGRDKNDVCKDVPGYDTPCPTSTATLNIISTSVLLFTIVVSTVFFL